MTALSKEYQSAVLAHNDKNYWIGQMQKFADTLSADKVTAVQFGKQDIRGTESITLVDHRHCVPKQIHFENKWMMLGYLQGYNESADKSGYSSFEQFRKAV